MAEDDKEFKKRQGETRTIKYSECMRNHAIWIGGYAVDGCGEFAPRNEQDTPQQEALLCKACGCHRNFHRKLLVEKGITIHGSHGHGHHHQPHRFPLPAAPPPFYPPVLGMGIHKPADWRERTSTLLGFHQLLMNTDVGHDHDYYLLSDEESAIDSSWR